jgi:hypothetical protein
MPYIYPPAQGTLSGDIYSASRFLAQPTLVQRALRTIAQQRFIADAILSGRVQASGGGVLYEVSESIYTSRAPEPVAPGSNYPLASATTGAAALAAITKWGQGVPITDESISRAPGIDTVNRALLKVVNQMVATIDGIFLAAIGAAVTATQAATAVWSSTSTATMLLDVNLAKAKIVGLNLGYDPDVLVMDDTRFAELTSNDKLLAGMTRESISSPTVSGEVLKLSGLRLLATPNLPSGVNALILDSRMLGSVAYERLESPGYAGDPANGVESKIIRQDENDQWLIQGRRPVAPLVQEPGAGVVITGT